MTALAVIFILTAIVVVSLLLSRSALLKCKLIQSRVTCKSSFSSSSSHTHKHTMAYDCQDQDPQRNAPWQVNATLLLLKCCCTHSGALFKTLNTHLLASRQLQLQPSPLLFTVIIQTSFYHSLMHPSTHAF